MSNIAKNAPPPGSDAYAIYKSRVFFYIDYVNCKYNKKWYSHISVALILQAKTSCELSEVLMFNLWDIWIWLTLYMYNEWDKVFDFSHEYV